MNQTILLLVLMIWQCFSQWIPWMNKTGYIPAYIYPIDLVTGDQIVATLSWLDSSSDMDLYLYDSTMNKLTQGPFIDAALTFEDNPEIISHIVTQDDTYYLRANLFSQTPIGFYLNVEVNGELVLQIEDTVINYLRGLAMIQVNALNAPCSMKIQYDGPTSQLYLYPPNSDVQNPAQAIANGVNIFQGFPTSGGNHYISIKHGINQSAYSITPFTLNISTDTQNRCQTYCQARQYTVDMVPGSQNSCICIKGYFWLSQNSSCSLNCPLIPNAVDLISQIECSCENGYFWHKISQKCIYRDFSLLIGLGVTSVVIILVGLVFSIYKVYKQGPMIDSDEVASKHTKRLKKEEQIIIEQGTGNNNYNILYSQATSVRSQGPLQINLY